MLKRILFSLLFLLILAVVTLFFYRPATSQSERSRPAFSRGTIVFEKADGKNVSFKVEEALTQQQHSYGLMFKPSMAADEGMLFVFPEEQKAFFWMKNTKIPLDILFIKANGKIVRIAQGKPFDLTKIESGEPVSYVVELNAGRASVVGLKVGDRLKISNLTGNR
ncbi:MAG TPA: DUF192 domain-containing protein [Rhodospirillaceae bacterium]|nr:DUF192 domain-containing protein [Rhodospirillaceae bacterium]